MARLNTPSVTTSTSRLTSPVTSATTQPDTRTANQGLGWTRDSKSELFLLAVTNMVGEDTFYEGKSERDQRFRDLVRQVAAEDPAWVARFIPWLRSEANMRTASVVAAVEFAQVHKAQSGDAVTTRAVVSAALQRADEPGEAVAYAKTMGYPLAGGLQRGIADAVQRLYTERNFLKYDSDSRAVRFGDVLELTHPKASAPWQGDLFAYAISKRHKRDGLEIPESLQMLRHRAFLETVPVAERRKALLETRDFAGSLANAGMTWESLSGWLQGPMDAAAWEAIIPSMGYMALLRNLRNFDQAGVSDAVAAQVAAKLADPAEVAKSRQLPMRFLSAYNAAPSLRWAWSLEQALQASLTNIPVLRGRTLVMVDTSGSMNSPFSRDGSLHRWDAAAMFGLALGIRAEDVDLVSFSDSTKVFPLNKSGSLLKQLEEFKRGYFLNSGTSTGPAVQRHYASHDRVVVLTDEQADAWGWNQGYYNERAFRSVSDAVPENVPLYTFNLAGYRAGHTPAGSDNRHTFGGLTDTGFKMIGLLEARKSAVWPF